MRCFEDLPRSTQIRYMRRLGQTALTAYELEQAKITPLQHFLNTTFRIDIPYPKQRYALRISRAGYQDGVNVPARPGRASYGPLAPGPAGWDAGRGDGRGVFSVCGESATSGKVAVGPIDPQ